MSGLFQRLDSAFQSLSTSGGREGDTDSLLDSGSEVESLSETAKHMEKENKVKDISASDRQFYVQSNDIKLNVGSENSHTNLAFNVSDETDATADNHIATRL